MRWLATAALASGLSLTAVGGCGAGTGDEAVRAADDWVNAWSSQVRPAGRTPNRFVVPRPPRIDLPPAAQQIGGAVDQGAADTSSGLGANYQEVKRVMCTWFGWYVETGSTVPSAQQFEGLFLRYGLSYLRPPPNQRVRNGIELFRGAIERAQTEEEAVRNTGAAAACTIP